VGVKVVGNLAHDLIDRPLAGSEASVGDQAELSQHVGPLVIWRDWAMAFPDHHRHVTHLAIGYPTHVVFVVPF